MLSRLWEVVRGHRVEPAVLADKAGLVEKSRPGKRSRKTVPDWKPDGISGVTVIIDYRDAKGKVSARQIQCRKLSIRGDLVYLSAWCFKRDAMRAFRCDRIVEVSDPVTGEVLGSGENYFSRFAIGDKSDSAYHLGLSPQQYGLFNAMLNVLVFFAKCDKEWHPLERAAVEATGASLWQAAGFKPKFDGETVANMADRLAPNAETFMVSLRKCMAERAVIGVLVNGCADVIAADQRTSQEESDWGERMLAVLDELDQGAS